MGVGFVLPPSIGHDEHVGGLQVPVQHYVLVAVQQGEGDLARAQAIMARHGTMEAARAEALAWAAASKAALTGLPDHPLRTMLSGLCDFVVARIS